CIARLSLTPLARPVQSARTTCRWGRAAAAASVAAQAGRTTDSAGSIGLPLAMGIRSATFCPPASRPGGYLRGEMSSKTDGRGARPTFTDQEALLFHSQGRPGKLEVVATKPMATQRDLSLAYSPGVALPVLAIAEHEDRAFDYTTKGNFVAVITNGTAIL